MTQILNRLLLSLGILIALTSSAHADLRALAHNLPDIPADRIDQAVASAIVHATPVITAGLIVMLCWAESRCLPKTHDNTGCGVLQVDPKDMDESPSMCAIYAESIESGIAIGVREIELLLADHRVHGNLRLALQYRACGNIAFDGTCSLKKLRWVDEVIRIADILDGKPAQRKPSV
jgi:energy-converting hydrogenase Eha subunit A